MLNAILVSIRKFVIKPLLPVITTTINIKPVRDNVNDVLNTCFVCEVSYAISQPFRLHYYVVTILATVIPTGSCTLALTPPGLAVNAALTASLTEGVVPTVK